jgi:hypothetical protein
MQPNAFSPWAWRDPSWFTDQVPPTDEVEQTEAARRGHAAIDGYDVEATDGGIGSVDEASYEVDNAHLVVDTGPWIFGRKVLLPAGTVHRVDHAERKVYVDLTKEQIKNSPEYDEETFGKPDYRSDVGSYYEQTYRG